MKKIVVLNSGGFDSTLLLADLADSGLYEIHTLYFKYGQLNEELGNKLAKDNSDKLGLNHHVIELPKFDWTTSEFYKKGVNNSKTQYLEMRNMVFISYAMSFAQSICASEIYSAMLKGDYDDCNSDFISAVNSLCNLVGISFKAPYSIYEKQNLYTMAKMLEVGTKYKFISCDTPNEDGSPCGKCFDCRAISEYNKVLNNDVPIKRFFSCRLNTHDAEFQKLFRETPIEEMRVLLNNDCQLNCKHCYHNNNGLIGDILTDAELVESIKEAYSLGIRSIHYAGKEPLFDNRIFRITNSVKEFVPEMDFSVVTNGINVPKYIQNIKECGISKVFLSIDDEFSSEDITRPHAVNQTVKKAVEALNNAGIKVQLFYDLTPNNIINVIPNIAFWRKNYDVKEFFIRTLRLVGGAESIPQLSIKDICDLHTQLKMCKLDVNIMLNIGACPYIYDILLCEEDYASELITDINYCGISGDFRVTDNYELVLEAYCCRYEHQITLTADGYILGCAMESSVKNYNTTSAGNVRERSLKDLILLGKEQSLKVNESQIKENKVNFKKCEFNPIDIY